MARSRRSPGFWLFLVFLVLVIVAAGLVFATGYSSGEAFGVSLSVALSVLFFLAFPILSGAFTAYLAKRMEPPLSPWLWAVMGVLFPVVAIVALLIAAAANRAAMPTRSAPTNESAPSAVLVDNTHTWTDLASPPPTTKRCPYCGSAIPCELTRCPNCAAWQ